MRRGMLATLFPWFRVPKRRKKGCAKQMKSRLPLRCWGDHSRDPATARRCMLVQAPSDVLPCCTAPISQIIRSRLSGVRCRRLLTWVSSSMLLLVSATNSALGAGVASAEGPSRPTLRSQNRHDAGTAGHAERGTTAFDPQSTTEQLERGEVGTSPHQQPHQLFPSHQPRRLGREVSQPLATTEFMVEILPICNILHLVTSVFALAAHAHLCEQKSRALPALAQRGEMSMFERLARELCT